MDPDKITDPTADPADDVSIEDAVRASLDIADDQAFTAEDDDEASPEKPADTAAEPAKSPDPEPAKPDPAETAKPDAPDKAEADKAAVDAEIKDLGIKNVRAQERFRALTQEASEGRAAKAQIAELEGYRERAQRWEEVITSTGAPPQEFGFALDILKSANTGRREDAERALGMIDEFRAKLATRHGIEAAGVDPLAGHNDLKKLVEDGDVTRAVALETARLREARKATEQDHNARSEQTAQETAIRTGAAAVDALCGQLKASDPLYAQKFELIQPLIQDLGATLPPAQWVGAFKRLYDNVKVPEPAADPRRAGSPEPLRRTSGGGGAPTPSSMEDAVRQSLGL